MVMRARALALAAAVLGFALPAAAPAAEIHEAAMRGDLDRVRALLAADPGLINSPGQNQLTPLHFACTGGKAAVVELLISRGADIRARSGGDATPLDPCGPRGLREGGGPLIKKGADVRSRKPGGPTRRHPAARG